MYNPILSLIASFIAMCFVVMSYFVRKKEFYLLYQLLCIAFLIISYFFNLQFFAMVGLFIGILRTLTFFIYEKKDKPAPIFFVFLYSTLTVASYIVVNGIILKNWQPIDILCLVALVSYVIIFRIRNLKAVRFTMLFPTVLSILFNVFTGAAIFATLTYVFEFVANVVSIFKYHVFGAIQLKRKG